MPRNPPGPRGVARERGVVSFVFTCPPLARTRPKSTGSTSGIIEPRTKYSQANRPICQLSQTTGAYDTGMSIAIVAPLEKKGGRLGLTSSKRGRRCLLARSFSGSCPSAAGFLRHGGSNRNARFSLAEVGVSGTRRTTATVTVAIGNFTTLTVVFVVVNFVYVATAISEITACYAAQFAHPFHECFSSRIRPRRAPVTINRTFPQIVCKRWTRTRVKKHRRAIKVEHITCTVQRRRAIIILKIDVRTTVDKKLERFGCFHFSREHKRRFPMTGDDIRVRTPIKERLDPRVVAAVCHPVQWRP